MIHYNTSMDTSVDFMPSQYEFRIIAEKIKNSTDNTEPRKRSKYTDDHENYGDFYDRFGRNVSRQERRQALVPWVKVIYKRGKLYIPVDKKNSLKAMRLL